MHEGRRNVTILRSSTGAAAWATGASGPEFCALFEPFHPKPGNGRPPVGVERTPLSVPRCATGKSSAANHAPRRVRLRRCQEMRVRTILRSIGRDLPPSFNPAAANKVGRNSHLRRIVELRRVIEDETAWLPVPESLGNCDVSSCVLERCYADCGVERVFRSQRAEGILARDAAVSGPGVGNSCGVHPIGAVADETNLFLPRERAGADAVEQAEIGAQPRLRIDPEIDGIRNHVPTCCRAAPMSAAYGRSRSRESRPRPAPAERVLRQRRRFRGGCASALPEGREREQALPRRQSPTWRALQSTQPGKTALAADQYQLRLGMAAGEREHAKDGGRTAS